MSRTATRSTDARNIININGEDHSRLRRHEVEERPQGVVGAAPGAHLHPVPKEDEGDQHGRRLVERFSAEEGDQDAEQVGCEHARGDEHAHV